MKLILECLQSGTFLPPSMAKVLEMVLGGQQKQACNISSKDHILSAQDLYQFALNNINGMDLEFVESKEHDLETKELEQQHSKTSLLLRCSCFLPVGCQAENGLM